MHSYQNQLNNIAENLAEIALKSGVFRFCDKPVEWEFGHHMPVDANFDRLMFDKHSRELIIKAFDMIYNSHIGEFDIVAGNSTSGGPPAAVMSHIWQKDFMTYRPVPKSQRGNIVELMQGENLGGRRVLLIENRLETGRSSAAAVQEIRDRGGRIDSCMVIYNYNFAESELVTSGEIPYVNDKRLTDGFEVYSAFDYDNLITVGKRFKPPFFSEEQLKTLEQWHADPYHYGERH